MRRSCSNIPVAGKKVWACDTLWKGQGEGGGTFVVAAKEREGRGKIDAPWQCRNDGQTRHHPRVDAEQVTVTLQVLKHVGEYRLVFFGQQITGNAVLMVETINIGQAVRMVSRHVLSKQWGAASSRSFENGWLARSHRGIGEGAKLGSWRVLLSTDVRSLRSVSRNGVSGRGIMESQCRREEERRVRQLRANVRD